MDFTEKTVLITGGSRGIGRATAQAFAESGARVAINFRTDHEAATKTIESLAGEGHFAVQADLSHPGVVEQLIDAVVSEYGRLDILVNNAGIFKLHPIAEVSYEEWQRVWRETLDTNLIAAANACYCAARHMMEAGGGRIINVSSRGAFRGEPEQPAYGASKAAMNAMGQSLAQALAPYNIFVGTVAPGFVETDMAKDWLEGENGEQIKKQSPLHRVARPEEVARGILFLASEGTEFMTGAILDINGASYLRS
jgi:NAD(P)-dependent dehydrogenase (short-subunit alcohol dehydrogenase family)